MFNKKNGFTLIELLGVIVVISLIMLIITPLATRVIKDTEKRTFERSIYGLMRAAEVEKKNIEFDNPNIGKIIFSYNNGNEISSFSGAKLDYSGKKPHSGNLVIRQDGKINLSFYKNGWCASKDFDSSDVMIVQGLEEECISGIVFAVIELNGEELVNVEINSEYNDPGVIAKTNKGHAIENIITEITYKKNIVSSVDASKLGTYNIKYSVEYEGVLISTDRKVIVRDTVPPVLNVPADIEIPISYVDSFDVLKDVSASDNSLEMVDVIVSGNISKLPGEYIITYSAKDSSGNETIVKRRVKVVDTSAPLLTLLGQNPQIVKVNEAYIEYGATAIDDVDGDISSTVIKTGTVNNKVVGTYEITYKVTDTSGNTTTKIRTVKVIDDIAPILTLLGQNPYSMRTGQVYNDAGATAVDNVDGDISSKIQTTGTVNVNIEGVYKITYTVKDNAGNIATAVRTVNVDSTLPTITFSLGGNATYAKSHSTKVTVSDSISGINSNSLKYVWTQSTTQPSEADFKNSFGNGGTVYTPSKTTGSYYLWVIAKDNAGNTKIQRSNIFNIDNTPPVITLNGESTMYLDLDEYFIDRGATAVDNIDGVIPANLSPFSLAVNTHKEGIYKLLYTATDSSGNTAEAVRTVYVGCVRDPKTGLWNC